MGPQIEIQLVADDADEPPEPAALTAWARAALVGAGRSDAMITLRVVGEDEGRALNRVYRGRDHSTNVLSFPFAEVPPEALAEMGGPYLGDLALCAPVVRHEAREQGKPLQAHWAHMVVHGVLHLAGHDHQDDAGAAAMETRERVILAGLGFPDPYAAEAASPQSTDGIHHV